MANDFIFGTDGHVGLSHRKAGELLGVSRTSVWDLIKTDVFTIEEEEDVNRHGIRGEALTKLCTYYSTARRITPQARQRCKDLLNDTEDFQVLIDGVAGGTDQPQQTSLTFDSQPEQVELAPIKEPDYEAQPLDFIFGSDGHAGLSIRKTAELLKVSHPSLIKLMKGGNLFAPEEAESIAAQGFRGGNLVKLARYFSQARQVSEEARQHCLGLLEKAAIIGVQNFIDRMAGITEQPQQPALPPKPTAEERLNIIERSVSLLDRLGGLDDRTKLALNDSIRNIAFEDRLAITSAPNERLEWPISDRIAYLGYPRQPRETLISIGSVASRLYTQRHGRKPGKREQFVDGTTREVNCYGSADVDLLDKAIYSELGEPPNKVLRLPPTGSR